MLPTKIGLSDCRLVKKEVMCLYRGGMIRAKHWSSTTTDMCMKKYYHGTTSLCTVSAAYTPLVCYYFIPKVLCIVGGLVQDSGSNIETQL